MVRNHQNNPEKLEKTWNKLETSWKKHGCLCLFADVGGVGDAKPSIFYFFEVLKMAWDHAHSTQLVLLISLAGLELCATKK